MGKTEELNIRISPLDKMAMDLRERMVSERDMLSVNATGLLYDELQNKISNQEIVNMQIIGEVATTKSTIAQALAFWINKMLIPSTLSEEDRLKHKDFDMFRYIVADQVEYVRVKKGLENVCIVIDEFSHLARTGLNATTESAYFEQDDDVHAQKFVSKIACSPSMIMSNNCKIVIETFPPDKKNKISYGKLYHRNLKTGELTMCGIIKIPVGDILVTKWHQKYRNKKFLRMDLCDRNGIRDVRDLEFGSMVWATFQDMTTFDKNGNILDGAWKHIPLSLPTVMAKLRITFRSKGMFYSQPAEMDMQGELASICKIGFDLQRVQNRMLNPKKNDDREGLKMSVDFHKEIFNEQVREQKRLATLYVKYLNIEPIEKMKTPQGTLSTKGISDRS